MFQLLGVQVARAKRVEMAKRSVLTAIHKRAVDGAVAVMPLGLAGDEQADLSVHGGLDKAVYAYPVEHYACWQALRHQAGLAGPNEALPWGSVGENLTLQGLLESEVWVGDVLRFAHCALRVTQPREPCFKFNAAMGVNTASKVMAQQGCCGFYLAVKEPGSVQAGEDFELVPGPRQMSVAEMFRAKMFKHLR